jgi:hypothetical protein
VKVIYFIKNKIFKVLVIINYSHIAELDICSPPFYCTSTRNMKLIPRGRENIEAVPRAYIGLGF